MQMGSKEWRIPKTGLGSTRHKTDRDLKIGNNHSSPFPSFTSKAEFGYSFSALK